MKRSIVIYDEWGSLFSHLPTETAGTLIQMICDYSFGDGQSTSENEMVNAMFAMIKKKLDEDSANYDEAIKKRSNAGKEGMKKRWGKKTTITEDNTAITNDNNVIADKAEDNSVENDITNTTVPVSDKDNKKRERFTPPSLQEVKDYCCERSNSVDPEAFVDFYTSKGWKVGNQAMKDWKAAIRMWERNDRTSPKKFDMDAYLKERAGIT